MAQSTSKERVTLYGNPADSELQASANRIRRAGRKAVIVPRSYLDMDNVTIEPQPSTDNYQLKP